MSTALRKTTKTRMQIEVAIRDLDLALRELERAIRVTTDPAPEPLVAQLNHLTEARNDLIQCLDRLNPRHREPFPPTAVKPVRLHGG